jgi:hypothetical protein
MLQSIKSRLEMVSCNYAAKLPQADALANEHFDAVIKDRLGLEILAQSSRPGREIPARLGRENSARSGREIPARPGGPARPGRGNLVRPGREIPAQPGREIPAGVVHPQELKPMQMTDGIAIIRLVMETQAPDDHGVNKTSLVSRSSQQI